MSERNELANAARQMTAAELSTAAEQIRGTTKRCSTGFNTSGDKGGKMDPELVEAFEDIRGDMYLFGIGEIEFDQCYQSVLRSLKIIEDSNRLPSGVTPEGTSPDGCTVKAQP